MVFKLTKILYYFFKQKTHKKSKKKHIRLNKTNFFDALNNLLFLIHCFFNFFNFILMEYQNRTKILSIESSSSVCSVCLSVDDLIISEYNIYEKNVHDKLLSKVIKTLLDDIEIRINELNAIAVSSGPGSFTGLRIGFAIAKGICFDGKIKFLAIPTLKAIANEQLEIAKLCSKDFILSVIYSNENLFYTQLFDLKLEEQSEVKILTNEEIENTFGKNYFITGPAARIIKPETPDFLTKLTASTISKLAIKYYEDSIFVDPSEITPDYYQRFKIK